MNSTALDINLYTNLDNCELQVYPITITPTIPVRKTRRGLPKLTFYTPKEAVILDGCQVKLKEGTEPVQILVKANCLQKGKVSTGLKPIVPKISFQNSLFWNHQINLPTIWVIGVFHFLPPLSIMYNKERIQYKFINSKSLWLIKILYI